MRLLLCDCCYEITGMRLVLLNVSCLASQMFICYANPFTGCRTHNLIPSPTQSLYLLIDSNGLIEHEMFST